MNEPAHEPDAAPGRGRARALALAAITLWGLSFVATRVALAEIAPVPLIATRLVLGFALLVGAPRPRGASSGTCAPHHSAPLALLGLFGIASHLLVQAYALRLTSAVHTGWLIGLTPIWSAVLAAVFLRERFTAPRVTGLVLGFAGALLVVTRGRIDASTLALPSAKGDLLILLTTFNWAVYTIAGRSVSAARRLARGDDGARGGGARRPCCRSRGRRAGWPRSPT